jgi:hypothetical protein
MVQHVHVHVHVYYMYMYVHVATDCLMFDKCSEPRVQDSAELDPNIPISLESYRSVESIGGTSKPI